MKPLNQNPTSHLICTTLMTFLIFSLSIGTSNAEPQRTRAGSPIPDKQMTRAEVRSVNHVVGARLADPSWSQNLTDNSDASKLAESHLTIRFAGACEWTNEIEIRYRGSGAVVVHMLRPHEEWISGAATMDLPAAVDWTSAIIPVAPNLYQGFELVIDTPAGTARLEMSELAAYWFDEELTLDAKETADE